ncbi:cellobiose dehydrogenase [Beauveria bassiana ARSEF 2860]|uniref:Cellobiose dehydrogenase n=1 Tax=Beauveria bassiana (strain ARSEF 2860) TaxID=655819 RepID=J5K2E3_BEAB2|nr:cellobiose dehydrogenase [Beauveria bassiana ARSEF 2860]EJP70568.1 cellobiose dehydrogenase [Beauveria bassiana ARSEF 2860]
MHFRWMFALLKISLSLPLLSRTADAERSARHCVEEGRKHINICVSFSTEANSTTGGTDFRLTFEHQRYSTGGWTAVGLGSGMYGALMLIAYTGTDGEPVLSIRHGRGHIEPRPFELLPEMVMSAVSINENKWFTSTLTCYNCDDWVKPDKGASAQPFIWATNPYEPRDGASADAQLPMHRHKGHFTLEPSKDQRKGGNRNGRCDSPLVRTEAVSQNRGTNESRHHGPFPGSGTLGGRCIGEGEQKLTSRASGCHAATQWPKFVLAAGLLPWPSFEWYLLTSRTGG